MIMKINIEKADIPYSQWVRLSASDDNGYCQCYTCKTVKKWSEMECGHYIDRGNKGTRFLPINTHPQCFQCNHEKRGNLDVYRENLVRDYGEEAIQELEAQKHDMCQLKTSDINGFASIYSEKVRKLRKEKGL